MERILCRESSIRGDTAETGPWGGGSPGRCPTGGWCSAGAVPSSAGCSSSGRQTAGIALHAHPDGGELALHNTSTGCQRSLRTKEPVPSTKDSTVHSSRRKQTRGLQRIWVQHLGPRWQFTTIPVPGDPISSSDLWGHQAHTWCTLIQSTYTHKNG